MNGDLVSTKANIFDELHVNLISPKMSKIKNEQKMKPRIQESQISKNDIKPSQTYVTYLRDKSPKLTKNLDHF